LELGSRWRSLVSREHVNDVKDRSQPSVNLRSTLDTIRFGVFLGLVATLISWISPASVIEQSIDELTDDQSVLMAALVAGSTAAASLLLLASRRRIGGLFVHQRQHSLVQKRSLQPARLDRIEAHQLGVDEGSTQNRAAK
jgi:hypothetical protein